MSNSSASSVSFPVKSTTASSAVADFSAVKPGVAVDELPPHAEFFAGTNEELPPTEELPPPTEALAPPEEELPPDVVTFVSLVGLTALAGLTAGKVCPLSCWFLLPRPKECAALRTIPARNSHKPGG